MPNLFAGDPAIELGVGTFAATFYSSVWIRIRIAEAASSIDRLEKFENAGMESTAGRCVQPACHSYEKSQLAQDPKEASTKRCEAPLAGSEDCCGYQSFGIHPLHYLELNEMRLAEDGYYVTVDKVALSAVAETERLCGLRTATHRRCGTADHPWGRV